MMTRRWFLGVLSTGLVGACVVAKVPTAWLPTPIQRSAAIEYLRTAWFAFYDVHRRMPQTMEVGRELFEAYADDLMHNVRTCFGSIEPSGEIALRFKSARVLERGRGWSIGAIA
jgi:hypothetical protein